MKLEHSSFTPTDSSPIVVLNDDTITPNRIIFWVEGSYPSHGFDDGTQQVCAYGNGTATKNDRSVYVHNGTTATMSGRVDSFDTGEFTMDMDSFTATTINFLAIED